MSQKHIAFTVVNDLTTDQRMQRICTSLVNAGYKVTLIGRTMPSSIPLANYPFEQKRLTVWFQRGKLFYIEYNLRLFLHLLFNSYNIYGAIDLDTLLPHYLVSRLKNKPITYDAHEYFAELPEIVHRPLVRKAWKSLEKYIVPRLKYVYTINETYQQLFKQEYGIHFDIVRNATRLESLPSKTTMPVERYILYQGAVNVGRGIEEFIAAMPHIPNCALYICGHGDVYDACQTLANTLGIIDRVHFFGAVPPRELKTYTVNAAIGFTFFTNDGLSYYYSLANRFFDYMHSGIPQLAVNFPAYKQINDKYEIALLLDDLSPHSIANAANSLLNDTDLYAKLQQNCLRAREVYNWQQEEQTLLRIYNNIV